MQHGKVTIIDYHAGGGQAGTKYLLPRVEGDEHVIELEVAFGDRKLDLVNRLLDAERQPVPVHLWSGLHQLAQLSYLAGGRDRVQHTTRQRRITLGVDTHGGDLVRAGQRTRAVAGTVGDAANDPQWPARLSVRADGNRRRRQPESNERELRAPASGAELTLSPDCHLSAGCLLLGREGDV